MAIITFWNDNTGKIGQTHSAIALASYMGVEHNYKILLISTRLNDQVTAQAFGTNQRAKNIGLFTNNKHSMELESGIEGMAKLVSANRLSPEIIPNYTKIIYKNRLEVLSAPRYKEDLDYDKVYGTCREILNVAKKYYDIVFVDLNNGLDNPTTKSILQSSNIIIMNVEQKASEFEHTLELKENNKDLFGGRNILYLINNYDKKSEYSTKNVAREIGEKKELLSVPYDNLFADSVQEGEAAEFFLNARIKRIEDTEERTGFFIHELKRDSEAIIYKMQELQMRV